MGGPKHKKPGFDAQVRELRKQPGATESAEEWRDAHPVWRFGRCDFDGCQWSWSNVDGGTLVQILTRLKELESRPWKEILQDKSNGSIEVSHENIASEAKTRIAERHPDVETIWKLRVDKRSRVWGVRIGNVFQIMWWDSQHTVYPMNIANN